MRDLRVSVTDRCNFRCPYCMPAEIYGERYEFLNKAELLTFEETARLVAVMVRLGVAKVRLTGRRAPRARRGGEARRHDLVAGRRRRPDNDHERLPPAPKGADPEGVRGSNG